MLQTRTPGIDFPTLIGDDEISDLKFKLELFGSIGASLKAAERELAAEVGDQADNWLNGEPELDSDAIEAILRTIDGDDTPEEAARINLEKVRGKLILIRRAYKDVQIKLDRIRIAESNELLPPLKPEYLTRRRRVVFALCELSEANENLWKMGDVLSGRGFVHQHIFRPGRTFERPLHQLGSSTSCAFKFLVEEVRDGVVSVQEVEKFVRSPFLMDQLRQAENVYKHDWTKP